MAPIHFTKTSRKHYVLKDTQTLSSNSNILHKVIKTTRVYHTINISQHSSSASSSTDLSVAYTHSQYIARTCLSILGVLEG